MRFAFARRLAAGAAFVFLSALAADASAAPLAFVPRSGAPSVAVIDLGTGTSLTDIPLPGGAVALTFSPDGQRAYAVMRTLNKVAAIDPVSRAVTAVIGVGNGPWGATVSPDGSRLYVMNLDAGNISVIDTETNGVIATINTGGSPQQLVVLPDGTRGYVTLGNQWVQSVDLVNNTPLQTLFGFNGPDPIVLNTAGTVAYVGNTFDGTVSALDTATNTVVNTYTLLPFTQPTGLALSPDGQTLYVTQMQINLVTAIDTATFTRRAYVSAPQLPYGIDVAPDGSRLYVTGLYDEALGIIDTATSALVTTIPLGTGSVPYAIGRFVQPPPPPLAITTGLPPGGKWHQPYSFRARAVGVPTPVISVGSGQLPPGLTLAANGLLSGTPSQYGTFSGTLKATSGSATVTQPFLIQIAADWPVPPTINDVVPGDGMVTVYFTPTPDDGNAPALIYNAFCGFVGSGETSPIVIRGLPNGVPVTCTMNALNSTGGGLAGPPFRPVTPGIAPAFGTVAPPHATWNVAYNYSVTVSGAPAPTVSLAGGDLPAGLTFSNGTLSGTPTAAGSSTVQIKASNALGDVFADLAIVVDAVAPSAPTSAVATPGDRQVSLAFDAPAQWGGEAGSYRASCSPGPAAVTGTASPIVVSGLANGVATVCAVSAVNSAGASTPAAASAVTPRAPADLGITVNNDTNFVHGGGTVTYHIVVSNAGPSAVTGAQLADVPPATLTGIAWTCAASGGAACPAASGTGAITGSINLPAGGSLAYTMTATVPALPETALVHSVSIAAPNAVLDTDAANDTAIDGPDVVGVFRSSFD